MFKVGRCCLPCQPVPCPTYLVGYARDRCRGKPTRGFHRHAGAHSVFAECAATLIGFRGGVPTRLLPGWPGSLVWFGLVWDGNGWSVVLRRGASRPATLPPARKRGSLTSPIWMRLGSAPALRILAVPRETRPVRVPRCPPRSSPTERLRAVAPHGPGHPPLAEVHMALAETWLHSAIKAVMHSKRQRIEHTLISVQDAALAPLGQRRHACVL